MPVWFDKCVLSIVRKTETTQCFWKLFYLMTQEQTGVYNVYLYNVVTGFCSGHDFLVKSQDELSTARKIK